MNIKKNDTVIVIAGYDKGKKGIVLEVLPKKGKVKVQGVSLAIRHLKPRRQGEKGGKKQIERFIDVSNVKKLS